MARPVERSESDGRTLAVYRMLKSELAVHLAPIVLISFIVSCALYTELSGTGASLKSKAYILIMVAGFAIGIYRFLSRRVMWMELTEHTLIWRSLIRRGRIELADIQLVRPDGRQRDVVEIADGNDLVVTSGGLDGFFDELSRAAPHVQFRADLARRKSNGIW